MWTKLWLYILHSISFVHCLNLQITIIFINTHHSHRRHLSLPSECSISTTSKRKQQIFDGSSSSTMSSSPSTLTCTLNIIIIINIAYWNNYWLSLSYNINGVTPSVSKWKQPIFDTASSSTIPAVSISPEYVHVATMDSKKITIIVMLFRVCVCRLKQCHDQLNLLPNRSNEYLSAHRIQRCQLHSTHWHPLWTLIGIKWKSEWDDNVIHERDWFVFAPKWEHQFFVDSSILTMVSDLKSHRNAIQKLYTLMHRVRRCLKCLKCRKCQIIHNFPWECCRLIFYMEIRQSFFAWNT